MTKNSSKKRFSIFLRAFLNLSLLSVFAVQTSAHAFVQSQTISPSAVSQLEVFHPAGELVSISDKALLETALVDIDARSEKIRSSVSVSLNPIVSVYTYQNQYRQFTRLVFAALDKTAGYPYQAYEIHSDGSLGRLIETGRMLEGKFIRERIYDYKTHTVTLYNQGNIFEKRIYELTAEGEVGRPVQYRGRTQSGDLIHIRFVYHADAVTCVHVKGMTFSTYQLQDSGKLGTLLEIGTLKSISAEGLLQKRSRIEISQILRAGESIPVYIFHEGEDRKITRERVLEAQSAGLGAIGRVLRFKNTQTDMEYFYQNAEYGKNAKVKILNHRAGVSFTFEIPGTLLKEESGRVSKAKKATQQPMIKAVSSAMPLWVKEAALWADIPVEQKSLLLYKGYRGEILVWEKLLRGPPVSESSAFVSFISASFLSPLFSFFSFFNSAFVLQGVRA